MSEANTDETQSPDAKADPAIQRARWQPWLMRLRIIVLGVSLGLVAKWVQAYLIARRAPVNPPVQVKDASEKTK